MNVIKSEISFLTDKRKNRASIRSKKGDEFVLEFAFLLWVGMVGKEGSGWSVGEKGGGTRNHHSSQSNESYRH